MARPQARSSETSKKSTKKSSAAPVREAATALPAFVDPQLATLVTTPPPGEWLYEFKWDGYRMLVRVGGAKDVRIFTRRANDWTSRLPTLKEELLAARLPVGWYDAEMVVLGADGVPSFNALQNALEGRANAEIVLYVFDTMFFDGRDVRSLPLEERRALIRSALQETERLRFSEEISGGTSAQLLVSACKIGLEGLVAKRRGSLYHGKRTLDWVKLPCRKRQEFVIGGYTWPGEERADYATGIGALLVGVYGRDEAFHYAGKVGAGVGGETSAQLRRQLDALAQAQRPFSGTTGHDRHASWVRPQLVCECEYKEWPAHAHLRQASFKGLRSDKLPTEVRRASATDGERDDPPGGDQAADPALRKASKPKIATNRAAARHLVRITHGDRVVDPSTGLTKIDLAAYYAQVAPWLLPHLRGRHAYVVRHPEGIQPDGVRIFQQHPEGLPGFKGTDPALWRGHEPALRFETVDDLANAVQFDVIEFHTWNSTAAAITRPDRVIFDLDPGEGVAWAQMQQAAQLVRVLLQQLGVESWLKTTGGKGLHVVVPLVPKHDYPTVKGWSEAVAVHLAKTIPQLFVAKSGGSNRVKRIFVDYLRNGQSQSTATAFSARARPGIGVSMPIDWEELPDVRSGGEWTIVGALEHLRRQRADPWDRYWDRPQSIDAAIEALGTGSLR